MFSAVSIGGLRWTSNVIQSIPLLFSNPYFYPPKRPDYLFRLSQKKLNEYLNVVANGLISPGQQHLVILEENHYYCPHTKSMVTFSPATFEAG